MASKLMLLTGTGLEQEQPESTQEVAEAAEQQHGVAIQGDLENGTHLPPPHRTWCNPPELSHSVKLTLFAGSQSVRKRRASVSEFLGIEWKALALIRLLEDQSTLLWLSRETLNDTFIYTDLKLRDKLSKNFLWTI